MEINLTPPLMCNGCQKTRTQIHSDGVIYHPVCSTCLDKLRTPSGFLVRVSLIAGFLAGFASALFILAIGGKL